MREVVLPANGSTWRLQAEQEPFHPWGGIEAAAIEGCGGINQQGLINLFQLNNNNPFEVIDCRQTLVPLIRMTKPDSQLAMVLSILSRRIFRSITSFASRIQVPIPLSKW